MLEFQSFSQVRMFRLRAYAFREWVHFYYFAY